MALTLRHSVSWAANGKYFNLFDTTGTYAANNTGGYGSPNIEIADVATATLSIWNPQSNNLPDITASADSTINVFSTLPNYVGTPFKITNALAGFGTETFKDGGYYMTYTITGTSGGDPFTYTSSCYQFHWYNIRCCLDDWQDDVECSCTGGNQVATDRYLFAELKYSSMLNDICCTHLQKAAKKLTELQKICPSDCGCN